MSGPIERLVLIAEEYGHAMDRARARSWYETYGFEASRELIAMAARLVGAAALDLRERLSFARACRLMVVAGRDFGAARRRLDLEVIHRRSSRSYVTADGLYEAAGERGIRMSRTTAGRWASDPECDPLARLDALVRVRDVGSRHGMRIDLSSAVARMSGVGNDPGPAISRIERRARNRQLLQSHLCRLRHRSGTRAARIDAAAWCRCRGCFPRLLEELGPYTGTILRRHCAGGGRGQDQRDAMELARQDAAGVLFEALLDWPDGPGFTAFYGGALAHHLSGERRRAKAKKRASGQPVLSLDEPYVTTHGRTISWEERLDGYSIDPLILLLIKEQMTERAREQRRDAAWIAFVYDVLDRQP